MVLGLTQPLTEMITKYISWGKGLTNLIPSCADCHEIWEPHLPGTLRAWTDPEGVMTCHVVSHFPSSQRIVNFLTPNVNYSGSTALLTSKVAFYIFIQQI